jgi:hypothetical protein
LVDSDLRDLFWLLRPVPLFFERVAGGAPRGAYWNLAREAVLMPSADLIDDALDLISARQRLEQVRYVAEAESAG